MPHRLEGPIGCVNAEELCCYHVSVSLLLRHILRATTHLGRPLPSSLNSAQFTEQHHPPSPRQCRCAAPPPGGTAQPAAHTPTTPRVSPSNRAGRHRCLMIHTRTERKHNQKQRQEAEPASHLQLEGAGAVLLGADRCDEPLLLQRSQHRLRRLHNPAAAARSAHRHHHHHHHTRGARARLLARAKDPRPEHNQGMPVQAGTRA